MVEHHGLRPGLAAVLVGENPASQSYVKMKRKALRNLSSGALSISLNTSDRARRVRAVKKSRGTKASFSRLGANRSMRQRMGQAARAKALRQDWAPIFDELEERYLRLVP